MVKVLCAWCLKEGKPAAEALIGEREAVAGEVDSHGICPSHRREIEARVARLREEARRQQQEAERLREQVDP